MSRIKRTIDPWNEGSLSEIYRLFFGKLTQYKPHEMTLQEWNEVLFDVKNRDIQMFEAKKAFKMPGLYYTAPLVKIQGLGFRDIPERTILFARTDSRSDTVDVECFAGQGKKDLVFCLTTQEWTRLQVHLKPYQRKGKQFSKEYYGGK